VIFLHCLNKMIQQIIKDGYMY